MKRIFKLINKNNQIFMFIAPFRSSSDLTLLTSLINHKNKITFTFKYKMNENSFAVLNQKFYIGVFSNSCLLEIKEIPTLDEEFNYKSKLKIRKKF